MGYEVMNCDLLSGCALDLDKFFCSLLHDSGCNTFVNAFSTLISSLEKAVIWVVWIHLFSVRRDGFFMWCVVGHHALNLVF